MRNKTVGLVAVCLLASTVAVAQAPRTWVSAFFGDDSFPCSRLAPCKTFAGAMSKTLAGGEIDVLDPGGYGAVTINKSLTIDGGGGQVASVLATGTNAIVVSAGTSDVVTLRNLRINGGRGIPSNTGGGGGLNGIDYKAGGTLIVENCDIFGFTVNGILVDVGSSGHLVVRNTTVTNITGAGLRLQEGTASVEDSNLSANNYGVVVVTGKATVVRTVAAQNSIRGFHAGGGELNLTDCSAANNAFGVSAIAGIVRIANVSITNNANGISYSGGGQVISWGNNYVAGNTASSPPSSLVAAQ